MGATPTVNPNSSQTTEDKRRKQAEVLEMRTAGMSFEKIGQHMGLSLAYVHKIYENALQAIIAPGVEQLRKQEGERLDAMLLPLMVTIMKARDQFVQTGEGEVPETAIKLALAVSERRSKIFGLDAAPLKTLTLPPGMANRFDTAGLENISSMPSGELAELRNLLAKAALNAEGMSSATH